MFEVKVLGEFTNQNRVLVISTTYKGAFSSGRRIGYK